MLCYLSLGPGRVESAILWGLQRVFSSLLKMSFHQPLLLVYDMMYPVAPTPFYQKGAQLFSIFISLSGTWETSLLSKLTVSYESLLSTVAYLTTGSFIYSCLVFSDSVMSEFILIHFHLCLFCLDGSYMP